MSSAETIAALCSKHGVVFEPQMIAEPRAHDFIKLAKQLVEEENQKKFLEEAADIFESDDLESADITSQLGHLEVTLGNYFGGISLLQKAVRTFESSNETGDNLKLAEALVRLSVACILIDDNASAKKLLKRARPIVDKVADTNDVLYAEVLFSLGVAYGDLGEYENQQGFLEKALPLFEEHFGPESLEYVAKVAGLAAAYAFLGKSGKAREMLEKVSKVVEKLFVEVRSNYVVKHSDAVISDHPRVVMKRFLSIPSNSVVEYSKFNHSNLIKTHSRQSSMDIAKRKASISKESSADDLVLRQFHDDFCHHRSGKNEKDSDAKRENGVTSDSEVTGETPNNSNSKDVAETIEIKLSVAVAQIVGSNATEANKNIPPASDEASQTLTKNAKGCSDNPSDVAAALANIGVVYGALGDHDKEIQYLEQSLSYLENLHGENHLKVAITLANLAFSYGAKGDHEREKQLLTFVLYLYESTLNPEHLEVAKTLMNLGVVCGVLGDNVAKKDHLERALLILDSNLGRDSLDSAETLVCLASAYRELGDHYSEVALLQRALSTFEKRQGVSGIQTAEAKVSLGLGYGALGDLQKQTELLKQAKPIVEDHYGPKHLLVEVISDAIAEDSGRWIKFACCVIL